MEGVPIQDTTKCPHCDRPIPAANIHLHSAHCSRKLAKCQRCGDMVPKVLAEDHYLRYHGPVACALCDAITDLDSFEMHLRECPRRMVACDFCEFPLPANEMAEHQEVCGNRTELCPFCYKYVRLRQLYNHEYSCSGRQNIVGSSARDVRPSEIEIDEGAATERDNEGAPRREQNEFSRRRLLFTIAITGIAVILGSIFYQKKVESSDSH